MKSKQIMFFALSEDIENIMQDFESINEIEYFRTGLFDNRNIPIYNSVCDVPNFGYTFSGDWNRIDNYLIIKKSTTLNIREVYQSAGGLKFAVDQMVNPKSIEIKVGGLYKEIENIIIAGRIATISDDLDSLFFFKLLSSKIKKEFKKNGPFYVGSLAQEKLKLGWRLVTNVKAPKEFDLVLD